MTKMKQVIGWLMALCMVLSVLYVPTKVTAASETAVMGVSFYTDDETAISALPTSGQSIGVRVEADRGVALVLAAYDQDDVLIAVKVAQESKTVDGLVMTDSICTVRLYAWNNLSEMKPIRIEGAASLTRRVLQSLSVEGNAADIKGDTVTLYIPVWDTDGNARSSWIVAATTQNGETVYLGDAAMTDNRATVTEFEFTTVTAGDEVYRVKAYNQITDDFDTNSVFEGSLVGHTDRKWSGKDSKYATLAKGDLAGQTFGFTLNTTAVQSDATAEAEIQESCRYVSAAVADTANATRFDGRTIKPNSAASAAAGKGLRLSKTTSWKPSGAQTGYSTGHVDFSIDHAMFAQGNEMIVEYDMAVDYSKADASKTFQRSLVGAGVRYNQNSNYQLYTSQNVNSAETEATATLELLLRNQTTKSTAATMDTWHHVKHVFHKESATASLYIDGVACDEDTPLTADGANAGGYKNHLNLHFMVSMQRSADLWLDNLKITWDHPEPSEPYPTACSVTLGSKVYHGAIDTEHHTISFDVPLYSIHNNVNVVPIAPSQTTDYRGTPTVAEYEAQIRAVKPTIVLGEDSVLDTEITSLDLTQSPQITLTNPKNGKKAVYTLSVSPMIMQRACDLTGSVELVSPKTTTYNAGSNAKRHNAPLRGAKIGSGYWVMDGFAYQSLTQDQYNPATDRTAATAGYHTAMADGLHMTKDRSGEIALYSMESNAPSHSVLKTVTEMTLRIDSMSGDGMDILCGENRFRVKLVPNQKGGAAVQLKIGDVVRETETTLDYGKAYTLRLVTQGLLNDTDAVRAMLYINQEFVASMDEKTPQGNYQLNHYHTKFLYHNNTRAETVLQNWNMSYQTIPADLGRVCTIASVSADDEEGGAAENVLDRKYDTRWSSQRDGAALTAKLAEVSDIAYIGAAFYMGDRRSYTVDVQLSDDGKTYTTVQSGIKTVKTRDMQAIALGDTYRAGYVRLVMHGNDQNDWNSVTELSVYAPMADGSMPVATDGPGGLYEHAGLNAEQSKVMMDFETRLGRISNWLANIYDPKTGGFYMAMSGADDSQMAPGLEMTFFALSIVKSYGDNWKALPDSVKQKFIKFIVDRQDPTTGLFIDTQGAVNDRETARNQSAVLSWVSSWGIELPYPHPSLTSSAVSLSAAETAGRSSETELAASTSVIPDYLATVDSYIRWVESWDWDYGSWTAGDQVSNSLIYLDYLGDKAEAYRAALVAWLADRQDKTTGLWGKGIDYNSVSGAFKLGITYQNLGMTIPNAEKVMQSTLDCLIHQTPDVVHYARNPISLLYQISRYDTAYEKAIRDALCENLGTILSRLDIFSCPDGGYSQYKGKSMSNFGGIYGTHQLWEGDVDSTVMVFSMRADLYRILGIDQPKITMGEDFWNYLVGSAEVPSPYESAEYEKNTKDGFLKTLDFDHITAGTIVSGSTFGGGNIGTGMTAKVVYDTAKKSNVLSLSYDGTYQSGPAVWLKTGTDILKVRYLDEAPFSAAVTECDIKTDCGNSGNNFHLNIGENAFALTFGGQGNQKIGCRVDSNQVNYGGTFATISGGEWHKLRIECSRLSTASTFRCRVFIDGQQVSDNTYFHGLLTQGAKPTEPYGKLSLTWYRAGHGTVYIDRLRSYMQSPSWKS